MPSSFTGEDALTFVDSYRSFPIKGGGGLTLQNYLNTHVPAWGVVVNPFPDVNVLVWYDYANKLHVVEQIPQSVADSIAKPPYHTADESFLYNLAQNTANALPTIGDLKTFSTLVLVGVALIALSSVSNLIRK